MDLLAVDDAIRLSPTAHGRKVLVSAQPRQLAGSKWNQWIPPLVQGPFLAHPKSLSEMGTYMANLCLQ